MDVETEEQGVGLDQCVLASAVKFLLEGGEKEAAQVLLSCRVSVAESATDEYGYWHEYIPFFASVTISAPRSAYDHLVEREEWQDPIRESVLGAIAAVLSGRCEIQGFRICAELISNLDPNWQKEFAELAAGREINNQAVGAIEPRIWQHLRFRSESELRIAQTLDRAGAMFFPLPKGRVTTPNGRENKEPDFLVCQHGKWGILEVDGEPFHPPTRTTQDHERDRLFKQYGALSW